MIKYIQGDLFDMVEPGVVIPHVCNRDNKWGRGFVVQLMANYLKSRTAFDDWYHGRIQGMPQFELGRTQIVEVDNGVYVANMVAQLYYVTDNYRRKRPLYYDALMKCMYDVNDFCIGSRTTAGSFFSTSGYRILAPKFGSELAGGNWDFIECLIYDIWENLDVTIVEYKK